MYKTVYKDGNFEIKSNGNDAKIYFMRDYDQNVDFAGLILKYNCDALYISRRSTFSGFEISRFIHKNKKISNLVVSNPHEAIHLDFAKLGTVMNFMITLDGTSDINLSAMNSLKSVNIQNDKQSSKSIILPMGLEKLTLERVDKKGLVGFETHYELKQMRVLYSNMQNLDWLAAFPMLEYLEISYSSKLIDIDQLSMAGDLKYLEFCNCKSILKFDVLSRLSKLEGLNIQKCGDLHNLSYLLDLHNVKSLALCENKSIDTISTLKKLPKLRYLSIVDTPLLDNDTNSIVHLDEFYFTSRKSYNLQRIMNKDHTITQIYPDGKKETLHYDHVDGRWKTEEKLNPKEARDKALQEILKNAYGK